MEDQQNVDGHNVAIRVFVVDYGIPKNGNNSY